MFAGMIGFLFFGFPVAFSLTFTGLFFGLIGFGLPFFGYGVYAPPPPYYYEPAPVVLAPGYCHPYWVPGHYVYGGGAGIWVAGYWAR